MAFKMKGFPMRSAFTKKSGFKHADTGHSEKDHQHIDQGGGLRRDYGEMTTEEYHKKIAGIQKYIDKGTYDDDPNAKRYWINHVNQMKKKVAELEEQGLTGG